MSNDTGDLSPIGEVSFSMKAYRAEVISTQGIYGHVVPIAQDMMARQIREQTGANVRPESLKIKWHDASNERVGRRWIGVSEGTVAVQDR